MSPTKKQKLKDLLLKLNDLNTKSGGVLGGTEVGLSGMLRGVVQSETDSFKKEVADRPVLKALGKVATDFAQLRKDIDVGGIMQAIEDADSENATRMSDIVRAFEDRITTVLDEVSQAEQRGTTLTTEEIRRITSQVLNLQQDLEGSRASNATETNLLTAEVSRLGQELSLVQKKLGTPKKDDGTQKTLAQNVEDTKKARKIADEATALVTELRKNVNSRLASIQQHGGGNANRSMIVNGSASTLARYTDINMIASSNLTIAVRRNDTTKYTEFVFSASGGSSGSVAAAGTDTQVQFNDGGNFGATDGLTFNKNTSVLFASIISASSEVITMPSGTTTRGLDVTNAANINAVRLTATSSIAASRSTGGQLLVSNGTTNTGNAAVFYSNVASALGRIVHVTADNVSFDKEALYVESDSTSTTALAVIGATKAQGVIKVTHTGAADGSDSNAAVLSLDAAGPAGTDAQVLFINATSSTTGKLINTRNSGEEKFVVGATGATSILGNVVVGRTGSVSGAVDLLGTTSGAVRIQSASVAGSWVLTLPPNDGSSNQILTTDGNGITTWTSAGAAGITRTTSIISVDTTGGTTTATDYVYIANVGISFTLPDAANNSNLYTLKNASSSSVLVTAIGGDTIDGSGSVLSAINNQSLDFISDGTNYRIV